jgi:hypothetical protein
MRRAEELGQRLKSEELELLRKVFWKRKPALLAYLDTLGRVALTIEQREEIRHVLADELCERGLNEDEEPNERGLKLDGLIGALTHY